MVAFDIANLGGHLLVICLSLFIGILCSAIGALMSGLGTFDMNRAIASGGTAYGRRNKIAIALRIILWVALILTSFALFFSGWTLVGRIVAIIGSICLPSPIFKLIKK